MVVSVHLQHLSVSLQASPRREDFGLYSSTRVWIVACEVPATALQFWGQDSSAVVVQLLHGHLHNEMKPLERIQ